MITTSERAGIVWGDHDRGWRMSDAGRTQVEGSAYGPVVQVGKRTRLSSSRSRRPRYDRDPATATSAVPRREQTVEQVWHRLDTARATTTAPWWRSPGIAVGKTATAVYSHTGRIPVR